MAYIDLFSPDNLEEFSPHFEIFVKPLVFNSPEVRRNELRDRLQDAKILLKRGKPGKARLSFFFEAPYSYPTTTDIPQGRALNAMEPEEGMIIVNEIGDEQIGKRPDIDTILGILPLDARVKLEIGYTDNYKKFGPFYVVDHSVKMAGGGTVATFELQTFGVMSHATSFKVYSEGSLFAVMKTIFERSGFTINNQSFKGALDDSYVSIYLDLQRKLNELSSTPQEGRDANWRAQYEKVSASILSMEGGSETRDELKKSPSGEIDFLNQGRGLSVRDLGNNTQTRNTWGNPIIDENHPFVQIGESDYFLALRIAKDLGVDFFVDPDSANPQIKFQSLFSTSAQDRLRLIYNPNGTDGDRSNVSEIEFKTKKARPSAVRRRTSTRALQDVIPNVNAEEVEASDNTSTAGAGNASSDEASPPAAPDAVSSGLEKPTLADIETTNQRTGLRLSLAQRSAILTDKIADYNRQKHLADLAAQHQRDEEFKASLVAQYGSTEVERESTEATDSESQASPTTRENNEAAVRRRVVQRARRASKLLGADVQLLSGSPHPFPGQMVDLETHSSIYSGEFQVDSVEHNIRQGTVFATKLSLVRKRISRKPSTPTTSQASAPAAPEEPTVTGTGPSVPTSPAEGSTNAQP
jgi:hypothetical protein